MFHMRVAIPITSQDPCRSMVAILGAAMALACSAGFAATATPAVAQRKPALDVVALHKALAARAVFKAQSIEADAMAGSAATTGGGAVPAEIYANPNRAYPPSCLNDGLPFGESSADPNAAQVSVNLLEYDSSTGYYDLSEADTLTVWRIPCSGGVSATVMEIDRPAGKDGNTSLYPIFPNIYVTPTGSSTASYPRLPQDPNTLYSDTPVTSPLIYSSIYVLDYYDSTQSSASSGFDYNQAFTLHVDNLGGGSAVGISVPAYHSANFNNYPSASNPMQISGYMTAGWYDPAHSGEGMFIQVFDNGDQATRTLAASWYTYDELGAPFWLYSQGVVNIGDNQLIDAPVAYRTGGGFAGNFGAASAQHIWGKMSFSFPDCGHMTVSYQSTTNDLPNGPKGSGTLHWIRLGNVNSLNCQ